MDAHNTAAVLASVNIILAASTLVVSRNKRHGREWEGPQCKRRAQFGSYKTVVPYLILDQTGDTVDFDNHLPGNRLGTFRNFFRMDHENFDILYNLVAPIISKKDTSFRVAITAEERLMVTIRFLATGASFADLFYNWKISTASDRLVMPYTQLLAAHTLELQLQQQSGTGSVSSGVPDGSFQMQVNTCFHY